MAVYGLVWGPTDGPTPPVPPSSQSVEQACETHLMGLLAPAQVTAGPLFGIPFRHHDDDVPAVLDCIIFRGKFDDNELEGLKQRKGEVKLTFASGTKTPAQADLIAAAMENFIYNQTLWPQDIVFPGWGSIEPESTSEREDSAKVRKRIFTVPMLALYIPPLSKTADTTNTTADTTEQTADAA